MILAFSLTLLGSIFILRFAYESKFLIGMLYQVSVYEWTPFLPFLLGGKIHKKVCVKIAYYSFILLPLFFEISYSVWPL